MAKATSQHPGTADPVTNGDHENVGLLSAEAEAALFEDDDDVTSLVNTSRGASPIPPPSAPPSIPVSPAAAARPAVRSAISTSSPPVAADHTPRTPQRVRFDPNPTILHGLTPNGTATSFDTQRSSRPSHDDEDERDSLDDLDFQIDDSSAASRGRTPLLTGIEAPSVALANSPWAGEYEDVHDWAEAERARPKSGLQSAFMNMANSIIGAGIIGQPYAFRQAGLLAGVVLLVGLTVMVDWTICLIVVNSKLSGANSFQGTVEKCFGKSGLIAISLAQWLFAFGGMVAFGVIVGDTIPHVLQAVWPGLSDMPILGLLANRKVAIMVFVLGVSYPLTLYRDIAKVRTLQTSRVLRWNTHFDTNRELIMGTACESQHARSD